MKQKRPVVVVGDIAYVHLTKGYMATVDADDAILVCDHNWRVQTCNGLLYAVTKINKQLVYMHKFLCPVPFDKLVDHKDRDGLNNRRKNLREATHQENMLNRKVQVNNTSGVTCVTWVKKRKKWAAQINVNGVQKTIGHFETVEEASAAISNKQ